MEEDSVALIRGWCGAQWDIAYKYLAYRDRKAAGVYLYKRYSLIYWK